VTPSNAEKVLAQAKSANVTAFKLGVVGGNTLAIKTQSTKLESKLEDLHDPWWNSIARAMA
jgi:hypothetical protein